jgi:EmrB/QacA subfamily drug resistance transporter
MESQSPQYKSDSPDYGRKWYVMTAVAAGILLTTIDSNIVNVALPTLVRDLQADFATIQWVVLAYLLTLATLMLSLGRLGDMLGKKPIYASGFVIFTIGSVLCGLAPNVYWLIGFRILQALGGAMLLALGTAIVTEAFPTRERGRALGITGTFISIGIVIGPTLGGLIIGWLSWRWIFYVNLPIGFIGTLLALRFIPASKIGEKQRFDFAGAFSLFVSLLALLLGLTLGQQRGFGDTVVLLLFILSFTFQILFIIIENRSHQPMIDLHLFRNRLFSINLITGLMTFIAIAGTVILMPFYLENILGFVPRQVGLLMAIVPLFLAVVAPLSGSLSDRFGTRPISVAGLAMLTVGYAAMSTLDLETSGWGYIMRLLPVGVGMGMFQSPNNSAVMGSAPREQLGIASGLLAISRTVGQTTGIALLGALWASRTLSLNGELPAGGATEAALAAQVGGLQETFLVIVVLMLLALGLAVWALVQEKQENDTVVSPPEP